MAKNNIDYSELISENKADRIERCILSHVVIQKKYLVKGFTAKQLSQEINESPKYISAVLRLRFGKTFTELLAERRVIHAQMLLRKKDPRNPTIEQIGLMCGFSSRQSFYNAFVHVTGITPAKWKDEQK